MADTADVKVKDIGSRPVAYTLSDAQGPVDLRFDTEKEAQSVLASMQKLVPPLMTDGKVVPIRGVIKERKGGPGRKTNAERAARAAQADSQPAGDGQPTAPSASTSTPEKAVGRQPAGAGSRS